jgi:flagellar motor switch protein FliM
MEKVLNQEEIDAMVRVARGGAPDEASANNVTPWDVRQAGQIGREQMRSISLLHEGFARNLTHSLGAYLRIGFEAKLVSAEHVVYRDFLAGIPEATYLASCHLAPVGANALLHLDLAVAFPLVDVLLGGEGKVVVPTREITEIEEQILETVMRILCRELQTAWQALALEFQFDQRQQPEPAQRLMATEDKTLSLSFEITVAENRGTLSVVVPAVVSNALLRKLSCGWARTRPTRSESETRLRARLLDCPFQMELGIAGVRVPLRELLGLSPGKLLVLQHRTEEPALLLVGEETMFTAVVAKRGSRRAAQILEVLPKPASKKERAS